MLNRPHTAEERAIVSQKLKGRHFSEEHKAKISQALKGQPKSEIAKLHMCGTKGRTNIWNKGKKRPEMSGMFNHNWKGGAYRLEIPREQWETMRIATLRRYGWTCQQCGKNANNTCLDVHHIIPYRISKNNSENNLIVLCRSCHIKTESQLWHKDNGGRFMEDIHGKM